MTIIDVAPSAGPLPPSSEEDAQNRAAHARAMDRAKERAGNKAALDHSGGVGEVNTRERVEARLDRLNRYHDGDLPTDRGLPADGDAGRVVEAIINTCDYVGVRYLDDGVAAARSIGRINIGRGRGFGTGFLVSSGLLLTNHHVLTDASVAANSVVEFNYQIGSDGNPLPVATFRLRPDAFYISDRDLDFALVAVDASPDQLRPFGFNKLFAAQGTVVIGEFTTIVHHPQGNRKMISLRENKLLDILERYLHYTADTEPGSSGSPVFNDQWEVVALHHASTRVDRVETGGVLNEGTRISRILAHLRGLDLTGPQREALEPLIGPTPSTPVEQTADRLPAQEWLGPGSFTGIDRPVDPPASAIAVDGRDPFGVTVSITVHPQFPLSPIVPTTRRNPS